MPSVTTRIRPRSAIADPALARAATVDLPEAPRWSLRLPTPRAILRTVATIRGPIEPERVIVLTLAPVPARRR
jgi:hypothetical protein